MWSRQRWRQGRRDPPINGHLGMSCLFLSWLSLRVHKLIITLDKNHVSHFGRSREGRGKIPEWLWEHQQPEDTEKVGNQRGQKRR